MKLRKPFMKFVYRLNRIKREHKNVKRSYDFCGFDSFPNSENFTHNINAVVTVSRFCFHHNRLAVMVLRRV